LSARAVIIADGKILLNEFSNGEYYNLPGGGVEPDETLRQAVEREIWEETGYRAHSKEMIYICEYNPERDRFQYGNRGSLSHVFRCEIDFSIDREVATIPDNDPEKGIINTGSKWVPIRDLMSYNLIPSKIRDYIIGDYKSKQYDTRFLEDIHE